MDEKIVPKREDTMRIVFSNEKMFDLDGIYNRENARIWAVKIGEKQIGEMEKNSKESLQKSGGMLRGRCASYSV